MAQVKMIYRLASLHFVFMKSQLSAALQNNHPFAWVVYPAGTQGVFAVMGFHECMVLGCAVDLSARFAVPCYNCGFWSSAEACSGL